MLWLSRALKETALRASAKAAVSESGFTAECLVEHKPRPSGSRFGVAQRFTAVI